MAVIVSALMCHAPIVVPDVVGARGAPCAQSTEAMRALARRVIACAPDVVVVLSPHAPRARGSFSLVGGSRVRGDFAAFGAPAVGVDLPSCDDVRARIVAAARAHGVAFALPLDAAPLDAAPLDHGALVPLVFLAEAGWRGRTIVVGLPAPRAGWLRATAQQQSHADNHALGRALADAAHGERVAIIASGDCSHRLLPEAPAGFHPEAARFDGELARVIALGDDRALASIDAALRELAAEDVVDTVEIAAGATAFAARGREVFSYQGPYGVGYLVALLHDAEGAVAQGSAGDTAGDVADTSADRASNDAARVLVDVAHDALAAWFAGRPRATFDTSAIDGAAHTGAFVTWRSSVASARDSATEGAESAHRHRVAANDRKGDDEVGALRGCVGRMRLDGCLVSSVVADLAVSAATSDPRFRPIEAGERVDVDVTLLSPSLPVCSVAELDPAVWGIEAKLDQRHGVLLPAIEGVHDAADQIAIVLRKASIAADEPYQLRKFRARKLSSRSNP